MIAKRICLLCCASLIASVAKSEDSPEDHTTIKSEKPSLHSTPVHKRRMQISVGFENTVLGNQQGFDVIYNRPSDGLVFTLSYDDIRNHISHFYKRYSLSFNKVDFDGLKFDTVSASYTFIKPLYLSNSQQLGFLAGGDLTVSYAETFLDDTIVPGYGLHVGLMRKSRKREQRISYHFNDTFETTLDDRGTTLQTHTEQIRFSLGWNF